MRALVLSGGAVKGAYQAGVLKKWLYEDGLQYDIICGTSVGALNAAFLSQHPKEYAQESWVQLKALWDRVSTSKVYKSWAVFGKVASLWKPSVFNSQPLQEWVSSELNLESIRNSGRKLRVTAVSWTTGELYLAKEDDPQLDKWVCASASSPVFLSPVEIDGVMWTDGGLRHMTPLAEAIRLGADHIDVIFCTTADQPGNWDSKDQHAIPDYLGRVIDMAGDALFRADIQMCGLKNDVAVLNPKYRKVHVRMVKPLTPLTGNTLCFDQKDIQGMLTRGYEDALAVGDSLLL